jgi:hypothetical protein
MVGAVGSSILADAAEAHFPELRGSRVSLQIEWRQSPIVAVGEVANIRRYGEQLVDHLPWPASPGVHKMYWCQGDFRVVAVVKGDLDARTRKYLWASGLEGCKLYENDPQMIASRYQTRAWFLREEGEFLRPAFDYGTHRFIGLCTRWEDGPPLPARDRLGALLLDAAANCATSDDFGGYFFQHIGDLACEVLGKAECVQRMRDLAQTGDAKLRTAYCDYLKWQQETTCTESR